MKARRVPVSDSDLAKVGPALKRAAARAKRLAVQSGTPLYVWKAGRVVDLKMSSLPGRIPFASASLAIGNQGVHLKQSDRCSVKKREWNQSGRQRALCDRKTGPEPFS